MHSLLLAGLIGLLDPNWRKSSTSAVRSSHQGDCRDSPEHPAEGIDAFLSTHRHELEVMRTSYQVFVRRTVEAFRGFEWGDAGEDVLQSAVATGGMVWRGRM